MTSIDPKPTSIKASREIEHICVAESARASNGVVLARCTGIPLTLSEGSKADKGASLKSRISSAEDF
jgi:hypothetical protein